MDDDGDDKDDTKRYVCISIATEYTHEPYLTYLSEYLKKKTNKLKQ